MSEPIQPKKSDDTKWIAGMIAMGAVAAATGVFDPEEPKNPPSPLSTPPLTELHRPIPHQATNGITNLNFSPPQQSQRQP